MSSCVKLTYVKHFIGAGSLSAVSQYWRNDGDTVLFAHDTAINDPATPRDEASREPTERDKFVFYFME